MDRARHDVHHRKRRERHEAYGSHRQQSPPPHGLAQAVEPRARDTPHETAIELAPHEIGDASGDEHTEEGKRESAPRPEGKHGEQGDERTREQDDRGWCIGQQYREWRPARRREGIRPLGDLRGIRPGRQRRVAPQCRESAKGEHEAEYGHPRRHGRAHGGIWRELLDEAVERHGFLGVRHACNCNHRLGWIIEVLVRPQRTSVAPQGVDRPV